MMIKKLPRNTQGRDWVVGDIHGCFSQLSRLLKIIAFDPARDRLLSVGDLVDRGPDSHMAGEWLAQPWFHAVRGNHEQMALDAMRNPQADQERHLRNGGRWLADLGPAERDACLAALSHLPLALEIDVEGGKIGVVHADCPDNDWTTLAAKLEADNPSERDYDVLLWARDRALNGGGGTVAGVDLMLVGHTPQPHAVLYDNVMHLDTGAVYGGRLTLFCLHDFVEVSLPASFECLARFQLH
ncbi:serine/threonine protein phosphatase [Chromobacterium phragmitis]|uniref:Metallophosphoesterase n=1 Tax=Chromobacterium phragmitis TaxID=2202141 RepID=A0A344UCK4_9NEIS|nr:metallophosphoesterase [Chromobacterium phragmitis]AXE31675.1 serine/threonine protein phosphatase [Chromobacterium phragmitis]AXE33002.1 serine/threonine protein phosphatase [Chromobacterium phragmitis]